MEQEQHFSPQDSLRLIENMISKTKSNAADSGKYFLLWGWVVFIACITQYVLKNVLHFQQHYYAWFLIVAGVIGSAYFGIKDDKKVKVKTYIDDAIGYLWMSIGISFMIMAFIFSKTGWQYCFPFYMMMYGLGCFISGRLIKFLPLILGGVAAWLLAAAATFFDYDTNIVLTAAAVLVSYIVPGHLLRLKYKQTNK